jgi:hypothetical protein
MKKQFLTLCFYLLITALSFNTSGQSVTTSISSTAGNGNSSACHDILTVTLNIQDMTSGSCDLLFQGPIGTTINTGSVIYTPQQTGMSETVNTNAITISNQSGTDYNGDISFDVELTDCFSGLPTISFTSSFSCGGTGSSASLPIVTPRLTMDLSVEPTHDDEHFLKYDEVDRYYRIKAADGKPDYFTLDITFEPDIDVISIDAVDNALVPIVGGNFSGALTGGSSLQIVFDPAIINLCNQTTHNYLDVPSNDYIIIREKIRITKVYGHDAFTNSPTLYTLRTRCEEIPTGLSCDAELKELNVICEQKNLNIYIDIRHGANYDPIIQPVLSVDPNASNHQIDYTVMVHNNSILPATLPTNSGTIMIHDLSLPINPQFFEFDYMLVAGVQVNYHPQIINTSQTNINILYADLISALTSDPDGLGGLTNSLSQYYSDPSGAYLFLPEGEKFPITFHNLRYRNCNAPQQNCVNPAMSLTGQSASWYFTPSGSEMFETGVTTNPFGTFDFIWTVRNLFSGYTYGQSDVTDVAPSTPGKPDNANLTFSFVKTSHASSTPWSLSQRPDYAVYTFWDLIQCPDRRYEAYIELPQGYILGNNNMVDVFAPFATTSLGQVPAVASNQGYIIDFSTLRNQPDVTLTINVVAVCGGQLPQDVYIDNFVLQFRSICDNDACYKVYGCANIEIFHHCPGNCSRPIGTADFTFDRNTFGWTSEAQFLLDPSTPDVTNITSGVFLNRTYECDKIHALSNGSASMLSLTARLNFEISYDPPPGSSAGTPLANIFQLVTGGKFHISPQAPTIVPAFDVPINIADWSFTNVTGKDVIQVQAPLGFIEPSSNKTLEEILNENSCLITFDAEFRVTDLNSTALTNNFYVIQQVRGEFTFTDNSSVTHSCDPWGDNMIFFKATATIENNLLAGPANSLLGGTDQCNLRYFLSTKVSGGFPQSDDFYNATLDEYRPLMDWPNEMSFTLPTWFPSNPDGYTFIKVEYSEGLTTFPTWTQILTGVNYANATGLLTISNLHTNYGTMRTIDKNKDSKQGLKITMTRTCPTDDPSIIIGNLDIINRAYSAEPSVCQNTISLDNSTITYNSTGEVYDPAGLLLSLDVPYTTDFVGNNNPITLPVTITHPGAGNSISNVWLYFTPNPNINSITVNGLGNPVNGLYQISSLSIPLHFTITVNYNCNGTPINNLYDPIVVEMHYGNACNEFPILNDPTGTPYFTVDPCLHNTYSFTVHPQTSALSLSATPTSSTLTACDVAEFNINASSLRMDVTNAILQLTPPPGFTFLSGEYGPGLTHSLVAGPPWNINTLLSTLSINDFAAGRTLNLLVRFSITDCSAITENDNKFQFAISGTSACGNPAAATNPFFINIETDPLPPITTSGSTTFCEGGSVDLTAPTGSSYVWSTGETNQTITVTAGGVYSVTVMNTTCCTVLNSSITVIVNPNPIPVISPGGPINLCAGQTITLTSTPATSYLWSTGETTQSITVSNVGSYSVTVTNSNGCMATSTVVDIISASCCTADAHADKSYYCEGEDVHLFSMLSTGGTPISYLWSGPNGYTSSAQNPTILNGNGSNSGTYTVTINDDELCSAIATVDILIYPNALATSNSTVCIGSPVFLSAGDFSNYPNTTFAWTGPNGFTSTDGDPEIQNATLAASGTYFVTVTNQLCVSNSSVVVSVTVCCSADAHADKSYYCEGEDVHLFSNLSTGGNVVSYSWTGPNGYTSSLQNPTILNGNGNNSGTYTVTILDGEGCIAIATVDVLIYPNAIASSNSPVCEGSSILLSAGNFAGYPNTAFSWTGPDGFASNDGDPEILNAGVAASGTYSVTVTNLLCFSSSSVIVTVNPNPLLTANVTDVSCNGNNDGEVELIASGGTSPYNFELNGSTNQVGIFTGLASANYTANVTDANGCSSSVSFTVNEPDALTLSVNSNSPLCTGTTLQLGSSVSGGTAPYNYSWTGPNTFSSSLPDPSIPSISSTDFGVYDLLLRDQNGCSITATTNITGSISPRAEISLNSSLCTGQSPLVHMSFGGISPWNYIISDGSQTVSGTSSLSQTDVMIPSPSVGVHTYVVTSVTDANCSYGGIVTGSAIIDVSQSTPSNNVTILTRPSQACDGTVENITCDAAVGQNIRYVWNKGSNASDVRFSTSSTGPFNIPPFETSTNSVYAKFGVLSGSTVYDVCVHAKNGCGSTSNECVTIPGVVSAPSSITGRTVVCSGQLNAAYSCSASPGATIYTWSFSIPGAVIHGQGTQNVTIDFPAFSNGQLCVTAALSCRGSSTSSPYCINISNAPATPGSITGPTSVCPGATNIAYSVAAVTGAVSYNWTIPAGGSINGIPPYSNSIVVKFPANFSSGNISVAAVSSCGVSSAQNSLNVVSSIPAQPGPISGPVNGVCNAVVQYSIASVPGATSYTWTIPATAINFTGQGTTSIQFEMRMPFTSGVVKVTANTNLCNPGSSPGSSLTIYGVPATPGTITPNPTTWCAGQNVNFSVVQAVPLPTYTWTVSTGNIIAGQGSSVITVRWGSGSGSIRVSASNACSTSGSTILNASSVCRDAGLENTILNDISFYPNPSRSNITLVMNAKEKVNFDLKLYDILGRPVETESHSANIGENTYNISLENIAPGVYLIEIISPDGNWKSSVIKE